MNARRAHGAWMELDGRQVFCRVLPGATGAKHRPPLLLLHGISCSTETWRPLVEEMARRDDAPAVIVPDLPAHGRSEKPARTLGMAELAEWTERLLRRLPYEAVDVFGHSMGCQVAVALAEGYPERVRRLVLLGPTTGGRLVSAPRNLLGLMADSALEPLRYNVLLLRVFLRLGLPRYLLTAREIQREDTVGRASRVRSSGLVLQGSRDLIVPERAAKALAAALPAGEYARVPGASHAAQFSHAAETADLALRFLAAARPSPATM